MLSKQLLGGDMPPRTRSSPLPPNAKPSPTDSTNNSVFHRSTGGSKVLRHLTRYEYNNTLRDLLGIDMDFATGVEPVTRLRIADGLSIHLQSRVTVAEQVVCIG
jgi:hypothetical protein